MKYEIKKAKSGIYIDPKNKGKFTATKKKTGKSTEELTHSKNPVTKKRAIFAQNAAKWKHKEGGLLDFLMPSIQAFKNGGYVTQSYKDGIKNNSKIPKFANAKKGSKLVKKHQAGSYISQGEAQDKINKDYTNNPFNLERITKNIVNLAKMFRLPVVSGVAAVSALPVLGSGLPLAGLVGGAMSTLGTVAGTSLIKDITGKHPITGRSAEHPNKIKYDQQTSEFNDRMYKSLENNMLEIYKHEPSAFPKFPWAQ